MALCGCLFLFLQGGFCLVLSELIWFGLLDFDVKFCFFFSIHDLCLTHSCYAEIRN